MTLATASAHFDKTLVLDPDTNETLFRAQVNPFDDSRRDSGPAYRRTLSVAASVTIPTSRVVKIHGGIWILGTEEADGFEEVHRRKFVMQQADSKFAISRLADYVVGTVSTSSWGVMEWFKDEKQLSESARIAPMYTAYFPTSTDLQELDVIWFGANKYLVEDPHRTPSGILSARCTKLEFAPANSTVYTRTYDPAQGKYTASAPATVTCLRVRWQSMYYYNSQSTVNYQDGDCTLVFPAGTTIATKDTVSLLGRTWNVMAVSSLAGAVVVHARTP